MACHDAVKQRREYAWRQLLAGRSTTSVVSELTEREGGCSRRMAQLAVQHAYRQIVSDIEGSGVDRVQMAAKLGHLLETAIEKAMAQNNPGAVAALSSRLMDLYALQPQPSAAAYGSRGRSRVG
jgi:hypothetical protein